MSDKAREMLDWVEQEMYDRLADPKSRSEISPATLIRMMEVLRRSVSPTSETVVRRDPVEMMRALGLPLERQSHLLAGIMGITAEEAATLLNETDGRNTDGEEETF